MFNSSQDKYFGVRLFSRPAVAVTLCWLIPLIFPDWTSSVSAFRETTITWLATSNKTRIVRPPHPSLYFSPTSSSSLSLIPLFNFLTLPRKASRVSADHSGFCFHPPLFCFSSPCCALSMSAPLSDLCEGWKQLSTIGLMDWVMTARQTAENDDAQALSRMRSYPRV